MAILLSVSVLFSIPTLLSTPFLLMPTFIMVSIILYAWFSTKFRSEVLQQQHQVKHSLRDWVRVNGIVALIFSAIVFIDVLLVMQNPETFNAAVKNYGLVLPKYSLKIVFTIMLIYALLLALHVLWTFGLMKKYKDYFN